MAHKRTLFVQQLCRCPSLRWISVCSGWHARVLWALPTYSVFYLFFFLLPPNVCNQGANIFFNRSVVQLVKFFFLRPHLSHFHCPFLFPPAIVRLWRTLNSSKKKKKIRLDSIQPQSKTSQWKKKVYLHWTNNKFQAISSNLTTEHFLGLLENLSACCL